MQDIKTLLAEARLPEKTVDLCLRGDLAAEHDALTDRLEQLPKTNSLSGNPERAGLQAEIDVLAEQMRSATVVFRLRALPSRRYQALEAGHPPRRDDDQVDQRDRFVGFNRETLPEPLIRLCVVAPVLDDEDWRVLLGDDEEDGKLSDAQFEKLFLAAYSLNKRDVDIPFLPAASPTTDTSAPK